MDEQEAKTGRTSHNLSDFDDWDVISASELDLDGMDDPFKDKWS